MMATRGWKVIQAHVPMIRFRKGGTNQGAVLSPSVTGPGATPRNSASGATGPGAVALPTIEDFQLPLKFQRSPIDPYEIEYINRGGPE